MGKLKNEFSLGLLQDRWVAGYKLGIGRREGGPGGPLMLSSKGLSWGGPKLYLFFSLMV